MLQLFQEMNIYSWFLFKELHEFEMTFLFEMLRIEKSICWHWGNSTVYLLNFVILPNFWKTGVIKAIAAAAAAKLLQSCPTLCDPIDSNPPDSPIPGILQARTLEWVAISFSNAWKRKVKVKSLSHVRLLATPWTAAYQAPPPIGFSRQEYWSGVPLSSPDESH